MKLEESNFPTSKTTVFSVQLLPLSLFLGILFFLLHLHMKLHHFFFDVSLLAHRNAVHFCTLTWDPAALLHLFSVWNSLLVETLWFSLCRVLPSAKSDGVTSSFPTWVPLMCLLPECSGWSSQGCGD